MSGDLTDLLARVEGASGPDREIDHDICKLFNPGNYEVFEENFRRDLAEAAKNGLAEKRKDAVRDMSFWMIDRYTASIDAALALMGRVLPGWDWTVSRGGFAEVQEPDKGDMGSFWQSRAATPALAILAATLRALIAKEGEHV